jgi:hypothetical protein
LHSAFASGSSSENVKLAARDVVNPVGPEEIEARGGTVSTARICRTTRPPASGAIAMEPSAGVAVLWRGSPNITRFT